LVGKMPIEVQIFQIWYLVVREGKHCPLNQQEPDELFPDILNLSRADQKALLRKAIAEHIDEIEILADRKTEAVLLRN